MMDRGYTKRRSSVRRPSRTLKLPSTDELELDPERHKKYSDIYNGLLERYGEGSGKMRTIRPETVFNPYFPADCGKRIEYVGRPKDGIQLTELEIAMICHGGFKHCGGISQLYPNGGFFVKVYVR